jgi:hypothetical protein
MAKEVFAIPEDIGGIGLRSMASVPAVAAPEQTADRDACFEGT